MLNLTQHNITPEQIAAGVVEPADKDYVRRLLTFYTLPSTSEIEYRAHQLAEYAESNGAQHALIGGAPFLMRPLEEALAEKCIDAWYAFSQRECIEEPQADGSVVKRNVFRHAGFIPA